MNSKFRGPGTRAGEFDRDRQGAELKKNNGQNSKKKKMEWRRTYVYFHTNSSLVNQFILAVLWERMDIK